MKWINHTLIAGSTTAVVDPLLAPIAIIGATAPDWLEWVANGFFNARISHRQETHYFTHWVILFLFFTFVFDFKNLGMAFAYGGITHIIADSLTVSGVPFSPWSSRRFHLFGGRLSTGDMGEYLVGGGVALVCFSLAGFFHTQGDFAPFFYDWGEYYESGLIDASEWKKNRFKLF